ncbi:TPA: hypothetical protein SJ142_004029 [Yersinia enterocolitica]|nr:hypothetical protein [Yersinia enterocolitica]
MSWLEDISIPSGKESLGSLSTPSLRDEPPCSESSTGADDIAPQLVEDAKSYRKLREVFAKKAYKVAKKSLYGWALLLFIQGWFSLIGVDIFSDKVLIAITTAVTLNVFAAFLGVIRGLFPSSTSRKE